MINIERQPNTIYVLSLSYGKDSIATLEACKQLGYPVDAVVHSEVWFNDEISADLPPMLEFKKYADKVIKERYGLDVTHICAMKKPVAGGAYRQKNIRKYILRTLHRHKNNSRKAIPQRTRM